MSSQSSPPPEPIQLQSPPTDGITCLSYLPLNDDSSSSSSSSLLACSSWDGTVRLYDTQSMMNVCTHSMDCGPVLSLAVDGAGKCLFTGGLDGSVRRFDIETSKATIIGHHSPNIEVPTNQEQLACSCLSPLSSPSPEGSVNNKNEPTSVLASAGWDSNFYLWDVRMNSSGGSGSDNNITNKPAAHIELPNKAFSMDVDPSTGTRLVIATAGRRTCFIDVRMMKSTQENTTADDAAAGKIVENVELTLDRESTLKYQTRVCRFFPNGTGIAVGSIEGRVAIEFLDDLGIASPNGMKKYAFKCHRVNDAVYPVNAIAFHRSYGTFATGGCDGTVLTWDGLHKKKLSSLYKFPTSISAMCFSCDGSELAIASSYTFEEGERDHPRDEIYIRKILDSEIMPKSMKKTSA
eukprot:CAMPEP_0203678898 /NCGR_PEP_ID=MMETSP0090-20130426/33672_1 /ASSEMBLY_ACC=CAM_ASM_001088 /TAXON_ID=426623 /ORGANISM="Chaetoceros affinis, Strain CCMP159" /LENGTH=405 /DNA_ID=CAMNT_0050546341 /DNA_START=63 /DNA_END=1280 /DNA_ORIENTATION=-